MFDLMKAFENFRVLDEMFKDCSREELLACIGMTIDFWAARHEDNPAEMLKDLQEVSAGVNGALGQAVV